MAYQEYGMWEVLDILKRHYRKESQGHIARATGRSTKTVRRYLRKAKKLGWKGDSPPDEALAQQVGVVAEPWPLSRRNVCGGREARSAPRRHPVLVGGP